MFKLLPFLLPKFKALFIMAINIAIGYIFFLFTQIMTKITECCLWFWCTTTAVSYLMAAGWKEIVWYFAFLPYYFEIISPPKLFVFLLFSSLLFFCLFPLYFPPYFTQKVRSYLLLRSCYKYHSLEWCSCKMQASTVQLVPCLPATAWTAVWTSWKCIQAMSFHKHVN